MPATASTNCSSLVPAGARPGRARCGPSGARGRPPAGAGTEVSTSADRPSSAAAGPPPSTAGPLSSSAGSRSRTIEQRRGRRTAVMASVAELTAAGQGGGPQDVPPQVGEGGLALHADAAVGDVAGVDDHALDGRVVEQVGGQALEPQPLAGPAGGPGTAARSTLPGSAWSGRWPRRSVVEVVGVDELAGERAQQLVGLEAQHLGGRGAGVGHRPGPVDGEHQVRGALDQGPEAALAALGQRGGPSPSPGGPSRGSGRRRRCRWPPGWPARGPPAPAAGWGPSRRASSPWPAARQAKVQHQHHPVGRRSGHGQRLLADQDQPDGQGRAPAGGVDDGGDQDDLGGDAGVEPDPGVGPVPPEAGSPWRPAGRPPG